MSQLMSKPSWLSRDEILERRKQLRRRRRQHFFQGVWRFGFTVTLLLGLGALVRQPNWYVHDLDQIQIEGNVLLTDDQIKSWLALDFPIALWDIQSQELERSLLAAIRQPQAASDVGPFRQILVQRQLFPPGVMIYVQERQPVALSTVDGEPGFVDQDGIWLSLTDYPDLAQSPALPTLTLVGWKLHQPAAWSQVLQAIQQSSVEVELINWLNQDAIQLETQSGRVLLGPLTDYLPQQLTILANMHDLQSYCECNPEDIEYIDLSSPRFPTIQLTQSAAEQRWGEDEPN